MKNQLAILLLCSIAVYLVSGDDQPRGAKVDLKKNNFQYKEEGGQPGPRGIYCNLTYRFKLIYGCRLNRCSYHWAPAKIIFCF